MREAQKRENIQQPNHNERDTANSGTGNHKERDTAKGEHPWTEYT
jgi:hypothetical protein